MTSKDCKFKSFFQCYGHFLLQNRFGVDQVPLELNRRDFTLEERGITNPVHIQGSKQDLDKRQASIQVCIRVKGDQIVATNLIFLNANPAENRYEILPGLVNQKVHFDGRVDPGASGIVSRIFQTDGHDKRLRMKNHPAEEFPKRLVKKVGLEIRFSTL